MRGLFLHTRLFLILLVGLFVSTGLSQTFPDTILIPVTFYDFHSNGSCPDFNPIVDNDLAVMNMVQNDLDSDGLPVRGSKVFYSYYIENWFRSSEAGEQTVTNRKPTYFKPGGGFNNETTVSTNPYVNKQIEDTIAFWHIGNGTTIPYGTYEFKDTAFFRLDNKGFGKEDTWNWNQTQLMHDHNYSFSMKFEREFIYKNGMSFRFSGDDDVWVFINNKLALDIGGIHIEVQKNFNLDNIAGQLGLELDKKYTISFFFAERQATSSHIWITTNIISAPPDSLKIIVKPDSVIYVGDTATATSTISTDTGDVNINDLPGDLIWSFLDLNGLNHDSTFKKIDDTTVVFIPTEAYTTVKIWGIYEDTVNDIFLTDTVEILVLPGPPDHMVLEASPDMPTDQFLWDDHPLDTVYILGNETYNDQFYAILRDRYGNWIGPAQDVDWSSADVSIITAEQGPNPQQGQGKAVRATVAQSASTEVKGVCDTNSLSLEDDLVVMIISKIFDVLSAAYFETDARPDGYIDLVKVVVDDSLELTEDMLDKLYGTVTLPAHRNFTYSQDDFILTDDGFAIKVSQDQSQVPIPNTAVDNNDVMNIALTEFTNVGAILATNLDIQDSLAPVVYKGVLTPAFIKVDNDTLLVYFSEEIKQPTTSSPFLFCNQTDVTDTYDMELKLMSTSNGATMQFEVLSKEKQYPETGDSLWIEDDGQVKDITDLEQKKDTKPAPLEVIEYTYTVTEAYYRDRSGNGGIDYAIMKLDGQPKDLPDKIALANPFVASDTNMVFKSDLNWLNNDAATLTIEATMSDPFPYSHQTNFSTDKYGLIISNNFSTDPFDIGDKVAPVIDKAIYCPGRVINTTTYERAPDTLITIFSENVKDHNFLTPFELVSHKHQQPEFYHFELRLLNNNATRCEYLVDSIVNVDYPIKGDSIWIDIRSNIQDNLSNIQQVEDNRRVELMIKPKPFQIQITVLHPVDPVDNPIPDEIINEITEDYPVDPMKNGVLMIIDLLIDFDSTEFSDLDCWIQIFDAVGNLVVENWGIDKPNKGILESYIIEIAGRKKIAVLWSGQNHSGRRVEGASYMARVHVTRPYGGDPIVRNVIIAVKRKLY